MKVISYSLGQLQTNCYFLIKDERCLIIDPADEAGFILEEIQRKNLKLIGILATHGHFDHLMAVGEIQKSFNLPFYLFKEDLFLVKKLNETAEYFLGRRPYCFSPENISYLTEGIFQIDCFKFQSFHTPGHTPGSGCFYFKDEKKIFTGDTLFKGGVGRYDFSYSDKNQLKKSLKKLLKLPKETIVYPGHGQETKIGQELSSLKLIN